MFNIMMSNSDLFDKLYQEINRQDTFYFWYIGALLVVISLVLGFFSVLQWRLSDKQIENVKSEALQQVDDRYKSRIERLEETIKEHKQYQNDQALQLANSLNDKFFQLSNVKDISQQSIIQNDIILTIESIINNDMIGNEIKVIAMKFVESNIDNGKRGGYEEAVDSIYKRIMNDKKLKPYYETSQRLFDNPTQSNKR